MPPFDPKLEFPNMTPLKKVPTLYTLNGCGTRLVGERDRHQASSTFVSTLCISILFLPVFALKAYRVSRNARGYYVLGHEPLSTFAKACNIAVFVLIAGTISAISLNIYTSSPAYIAKQQMAAAKTQAEQGQIAEAAATYETLALNNADQADNAAFALKSLVEQNAKVGPLTQYAAVLTAASHLITRPDALSNNQLVSDGLQTVTDKAAADPQGGLAILNTIRPLALDTRPIDDARLPLLQAWAAKDPTNLEAVIPLASYFEEKRQPADAKKLLEPVKDKLGNGEGARVLGSIYMQEGKYDDAYGLLWPYVKDRLDKLHLAETAAESAADSIWKREIDLLQNDKGPPSFYSKYKAAPEDQKDAILREYVTPRVINDPHYKRTQADLEAATAVVPVTLELGIVILQRAQNIQNPDERKKQLESAEQTFLAIKNVAGKTDEYRLFLGQVYYWLGKQTDGRQLFDEFLESKGRSAESLILIADKLREVGSDSSARATIEEAYNKASKPEEKFSAAGLRAHLNIDTDDEILWLNRADTSQPFIKAWLESTLGDKDYQNGHDDQAAQHYKNTIASYNAQPRSAGTVNDTALCYLRLFTVTGDHSAIERCSDLIQQAVALEPSDTILLFNAAVTLTDATLTDLIGNSIDLHALHETGSFNLLGFLYHDQATRDAIRQRVKDHPGMTHALAYIEKCLILAPKHIHGYTLAYHVQRFINNKTALADIDARIQSAAPDSADEFARTQEFLSGAKDAVAITTLKNSIERSRALVDTLRPKGGITAAVAISSYAQNLLAADVYNLPADPDEVVKLAEEADRFAPSSGTSGLLIGAHMYRASKALRKTQPDFLAFHKKYARSVGYFDVLLAAANTKGPLQAKILANPDLQMGLKLQLDLEKQFPEDPSIATWVLLKNTDPAAAEKFAAALRKDSQLRINQSITSALSPAAGNEALEAYWLYQACDMPTEAQAALQKPNAAGIPVPPQP